MREVARKITRRYNDALKPLGIKVTQFTIMTGVALSEGRSLTEIASALGMDRTTLTRNLAPLELQGFVETYDEGQGRARSARLTDKGVVKMEAALPLWRAAQKSLKNQLGRDTWERVQLELSNIGHLV